mmetsp:Transcript_91440/g.232626  ORF Transcript_91440/g.232626 Transcript_91440/m.232626 type:complete len:210 (-) Transcript_91440:526-1155(-)
MASCSTPAEKTILPTWPEPPLRSSSVGSDFSFMALTECRSSSMSPSGSSTEVQKNCRPPMSAAPSISTPRLPPSLMTAFFFLTGSTAGFSSFFVSSCSFSFLSCLASPFGLGSLFGLTVFGLSSCLSFSSCVVGLASFLSALAAPAAPPPQSLTSPTTALNSGCAKHKVNQRMTLPKGLRKASSNTNDMPSSNAQKRETSARVMLCPTM